MFYILERNKETMRLEIYLAGGEFFFFSIPGNVFLKLRLYNSKMLSQMLLDGWFAPWQWLLSTDVEFIVRLANVLDIT